MSDSIDLVVRARRAVLPDGERAAAIGVHEGRIVSVSDFDDVYDAEGEAGQAATRVVELADDEVLLPGAVDSHVHVNDPGRSDWEGFWSATRAAAAGGVTTIVDMPLNSLPPTVDTEALEVKRKTATSQAFVDVGFWGGAVPGNLPQLRPLHEAGVYGFKCFLLHSGVDEFPPLERDELAAAMREIASFDGLLIVHAEDAHIIDSAPAATGAHYDGYLASRPHEAEDRAIADLIELSQETGCRIHILHVASADALAEIAAARAAGVPLTAETCPHYLSFTAEEVPDGATQFKCCPPIRGAANRERLWEGLREGVIDIVVTDHSPSTADLKCFDSGDFGAAWGGVSSLQLSLAAVWTGARERGFALDDLVRWMSRGPAELTGLHRKGRLEVGADADLCVFAPDDTFVVDKDALLHKNPITPYHGRTLYGVVRSSWLRGVPLDPANPDAAPSGRLLTRGDS